MSLCSQLCTEESPSDSSSEEVPEDLQGDLRAALAHADADLEAFSAAAALLAYCSPKQQSACLPPAASDLEAHSTENAFAVSWVQEGTWTLACRGTELGDWKDLVDDVDIRLKPVYWADSSCVHEGFLRHFQKLQLPVLKALLSVLERRAVQRVLFTGHSLGSTSSYLLAMFCSEVLASVSFPGEVLVRSFGGPKIGDRAFYCWCAQKRASVGIVAYQNSCDLVTKVPVRLSENWVQKSVSFQRTELPLEAHSMRGYFREVFLLGPRAPAQG